MCRRNGSEMRLFPRKAVILIPSCAVLKSVFLVTFVTTDKSNPSGAKNKNLLHRLATKEQHKSKIRRGVACGAREPIQNNRVNFNLYIVPL